MKRLIQHIFPATQPYAPMNFTRQPVLHQFWGGGLFGLAVGFSLGFLLWLWQMGIISTPDSYAFMKLAHARIQILGFAGSFLLGFALQAGPNVLGGNPPPSKLLLKFAPILWLGIALTVMPQPLVNAVGNLLISVAFGSPAYLLLRVTLAGNPLLRISRGIPIAAAFLLLATAPWLNLNEPEVALFVLWCGPVTAAMVAAQQLINNVLNGQLLQGDKARIFLVGLSLAWITTGLASFSTWISWTLPGLAWLAVIVILAWGTGFVPAAVRSGFVGINVTLSLGLIGLTSAAAMMAVLGRDLLPDAIVHLLGAGVITLLIMGVVSRVAGFFSGVAVLSDQAVVALLFLWTLIATSRVATALAWIGGDWVPWIILLGWILLAIWSVRVLLCLVHIAKRPYPQN